MQMPRLLGRFLDTGVFAVQRGDSLVALNGIVKSDE